MFANLMLLLTPVPSILLYCKIFSILEHEGLRSGELEKYLVKENKIICLIAFRYQNFKSSHKKLVPTKVVPPKLVLCMSGFFRQVFIRQVYFYKNVRSIFFGSDPRYERE